MRMIDKAPTIKNPAAQFTGDVWLDLSPHRKRGMSAWMPGVGCRRPR